MQTFNKHFVLCTLQMPRILRMIIETFLTQVAIERILTSSLGHFEIIGHDSPALSHDVSRPYRRAGLRTYIVGWVELRAKLAGRQHVSYVSAAEPIKP